MESFWDFSVWGTIHLAAVLLLSLLVANMLKRSVKWLEASLIPTSVLGGLILLVITGIYSAFTGENLFNTAFFGGNGINTLEIITYHTLALGFIASTFKSGSGKLTKERTVEIFNTGVHTVSTYLIQAVFGLGITMIVALIIKDFFPAAGVLLPFGYGQGTGQALNYGGIYENEFGFVGGKSFGLTIAALGFLSASIGGVIHLNILKRKGKIKTFGSQESALVSENVQGDDEIPMQGSMDKLTVQLALVAAGYFLAYGMMYALGLLLPGMKSVIYGFNFLLGVLSATLIKTVINVLRKKKIINRQYMNDFLMTRCSNFFFDVMVVAGIAAIRLSVLERYWGVMLILGVVGLVITYAYVLLVSRTLFPKYSEEQFLMMYGMLTGTASTGIILLREIDGEFKTPAADNMVYQNFPAIVFGFPMMLLATLAPKKPLLTLIILMVFFAAMNLILFRSKIFRKKVQ
ncbi:MAG: hypothetical protein IJ407_04585 [Clostridia bacterium]|nr:hypothetical protein [Clostridia bacterium]MBQ8600640.1 hypothetical protein [Clostridia bacterium]